MKLEISRDALAGIRAEAAAALPLEACGLLFGDADRINGWQVANNVATHPETEFEIDPAALFAAQRAERANGPRLIGYWHSHPSGNVWPSSRDLAAAEDDGRFWVIVAGEDVAAWHVVISEIFDTVEEGTTWNMISSGATSKGFWHVPLLTGEIRHLVPRSKSDLDLLPAIAEAGYPAIAPILNDLLAWTADPNWPICVPLIDYLVTLGAPMVEPIRLVLRGDDGGHKSVCLKGMVPELPRSAQARLRDDLRRLAERPSEDDRDEEVNVEARKILAALDK
ncbi:DUF5071 domain-containing protein [Sphingomonas sp. RT2P30]|uniref:DUF5071 domain-containing protein n=1 Tax=Parasphingomonas halimpatiens TaxID=3096162 RepID=UPI002FC985C0